jgi:hypothetical protein
VAPWGKEWEEIVNKRVEDMIQNHKPKCKTCGYNTHCASPNVCDIGENPDYDDIKDDPPVHYPEDEIPYD